MRYKMKKYNICSIVFNSAAILFYITSIVTFAKDSGNQTGFIWLCLGSAFLCLATVFSRKAREEENGEKEEKTID